MNWTEIADKYPKAWDLSCRWEENHPKGISLLQDNRYLYDFFDEQDIIITIRKKWYRYKYWIAEARCQSCDMKFTTKLNPKEGRIAVEESIFKGAFEILENKP